MELPEEYFSFVAENRERDPKALRLKYHGDSREWMPLALNHIEGLRKCGKKFIDADGKDFTPRVIARPLSVEQATSAQIGKLHDRLAAGAVTVLDMTCGLGLDSRFISRGRRLISIEMDAALAEAARANFADDSNIEVICADSTAWLAEYEGEPFDLVFIDPARRGDGNKRLFNISDCAPDVKALLPLLRKKAKRVMVKLSPMLDVTQTLRDLPDTSELHIVEERGDCRELLAVLDFEKSVCSPAIFIHCEAVEFAFTADEESEAAPGCALPLPGMWLCEPGPAAMKSGAFNTIAWRLGLHPLHRNTHVYVSETMPEGFPGKCREIEAVYPLASSTLKTIGKSIARADVAIRNLPQFTPEILAKRLGIKPGGDKRVIGCTVADGLKALIVVRK